MFKSKFINNIFTLSSGTFLSQLILFFNTPVLSRLYSPESFGVMALYLSIISIFWGISSGKYELAIVLPDDDKTAQNLLLLSIIINLIFFILSLIILFIVLQVSNYNLEIIFLCIPFGIFTESLIMTLNQYNNRNKKYKFMSLIRIFRSIIVVSLQLLFYYFGIKYFGLVLGFIISSFIILIFLITPYYQILLNAFTRTNKNELLIVAKSYIKFPKFQALSTFLNAISQNIILLLLSFFYNPLVVGYYSLAHRSLKMPVVLISDSVRQIFYKEGSDLINNNKSLSNLFTKTTISLLAISLPVVLLVWNFLPTVFMFIFGDEWLTTGEYAQILIFWLLCLFINPPTIAAIQILNLQKEYMFYESLLLFCRVTSIYSGYYIYSNILVSLKLFTLVSVIFNIILIVYIYFKVKSNVR